MPRLIQRCLRNPWLWHLVLACYWLALFAGTHMPIKRLALQRGSADKLAHVAAFAVLSILVAITWRISVGRLRFRHVLNVWGVVILYGAIEETTQPLVGRTASLIDWLADAIGATLGLGIFWWWLRGWYDRWVPAIDDVMDAERTTSWRRYSLRTLFIAMTIVTLACYWMMLPTMNAQRFVRAIQQRDYATAESLFIAASIKFPANHQAHEVFELRPSIEPLTWDGLWNGQRRIMVGVHYGDQDGMLASYGAEIAADRRGLVLIQAKRTRAKNLAPSSNIDSSVAEPPSE